MFYKNKTKVLMSAATCVANILRTYSQRLRSENIKCFMCSAKLLKSIVQYIGDVLKTHNNRLFIL